MRKKKVNNPAKKPLLVGLNSILGSGIFIASVLSVQLYGKISVFYWMLAGFIALIVSLVFRRIYEEDKKGVYDFLKKVFSKNFMKTVKWFYWFGSAIVVTAISFACSEFLIYVFNWNASTNMFLSMLILISIYGFHTFFKQSVNTFFKTIVTIKIILILIFIIFSSQLTTNFVVNKSNFSFLGVVFAFWAYLGFEKITNINIKKKKESIPIFQTAIITLSAIFFAFIISSVASFPEEVLNKSFTLIDLVHSFMSPSFIALTSALLLIVLFSVGISYIEASENLLGYSRKKEVFYQMFIGLLGIMLYQNFVNSVIVSVFIFLTYFILIDLAMIRYAFKKKNKKYLFESTASLLFILAMFTAIQVISFLTIITVLVGARIYSKIS